VAEVSGACSPAAWSFCRAGELWRRFSPLTPYGKDSKERTLVLADRAELERIYDRTEDAAAMLRGAGPGVADRLAWHLRRLPRLPFSRRELEAGAADLDLGLVELFQVKKFLANYRAVLRLLDDGTRERFGLGFRSGELAARLDSGGSDAETFFVADAYDGRLGPLRAAIAERDAGIAKARAAAKARSRLERGLDFGERDFLLVPKDEAAALLASEAACEESPRVAAARYAVPRYSVEAYDGRSCVVRLQDDAATLALEEERSELAARERSVESEVLAALSAEVSAEAGTLLEYADAIGGFDLSRARAVLAAELGCRRPELGSASLELERGRFLSCERECSELGLAYSPLDLRLEEPAAVLFGSNMGGKTVALQTLMFFQAIAQAGLFVPAGRFATSVYPRLDYVGELRSARRPGGLAAAHGAWVGSPGSEAQADADSQGGLSGFGFEIRSFAEAWEAARGAGAFVVLDEFARTTSSAEAEAILSAAIESMPELPRCRFVLATHFRGIERRPGLRYLKMRGLDRDAAGEAMLSGEPVAERIRRINRMMRYDIVDADEGSDSSDAIAIASLLGLDPHIAARAAELYAARSPEPATRGKKR